MQDTEPGVVEETSSCMSDWQEQAAQSYACASDIVGFHALHFRITLTYQGGTKA